MFGYVFDDTVLSSLGVGDHDPGNLLASLDHRNFRVCIPAVTLALAFTGLSSNRCAELLGIVDAMPSAAVEPLNDAVAALELSEFLECIPDDVAAAHALVTARRHDMEIITLNRDRWHPVEQKLPFRVPIVELSNER